MTGAEWVQVSLGVAMMLVVIVIGVNRWQLRRSIGVRSIQWLGIGFLVPGAVILALADKVGGEAAVAVLAALAGYLFASISKFDDRKND